MAAAEADSSGGFWAHLLVANPAAGLVPPDLALLPTWVGYELRREGGRRYLTRSVFTDGSGYDTQLGLACRVGGAVAEVDPQGAVALGFSAPLPAPLQGVPEAELFFLGLAVRWSAPPAHFSFDCQNIEKGLRRGRTWCTAAKRLFATQ